MTDLARHSKGLWRSIYIFSPVKEHYRVLNQMRKVIEELNIEEWSYCHYGRVESSNPQLQEKAHITFRINFPDTDTYIKFKETIDKKKWEWEDHNYDEPLWVKRAYVIGTQLRELVIKAIDNPDVPLDKNFLRLMLHGFFNDIHWSKKDEIEFYLFMLSDYLRLVYGIRL